MNSIRSVICNVIGDLNPKEMRSTRFIAKRANIGWSTAYLELLKLKIDNKVITEELHNKTNNKTILWGSCD